MTIPFHLDPVQVPFAYSRDDGMTDVNTIISTIRSLLVTTLGWSEPTTARFKTPVDASGRFLDILLTRISATNLDILTRNASAVTVCERRIQISNPGSVEYYCNTFGVCINSLQATPERFEAHVLDQAPDLQSDNSLYVASHGYRNTSDVADAVDTGRYFMIDNGAATLAARSRRWGCTHAPAVADLATAVGSLLYRDAILRVNSAGSQRWAGRICQCIAVNELLGPGVEEKPFIDTATGGTFKIVGGTAGAVDHRWAFRKA